MYCPHLLGLYCKLWILPLWIVPHAFACVIFGRGKSQSIARRVDLDLG